MKATLLLGALCALTGCSQQTHSVHLTSLPLSDLKEVNAQWSPLTRMESRYPKEAILAGQTGCSSLEYVINPAGRAEQIRVLEWQKVLFLILLILITVSSIDWISGKLRFAIIGRRAVA